MTTFNEREKSFEKKFAMDEELKFKAESRRNRLLGAVGRGQARAVRGRRSTTTSRPCARRIWPRRATRTCSRRSRRTSTDKGVSVADAELRKAMDDFLAQAVQQIEAEGKARAEARLGAAGC